MVFRELSDELFGEFNSHRPFPYKCERERSVTGNTLPTWGLSNARLGTARQGNFYHRRLASGALITLLASRFARAGRVFRDDDGNSRTESARKP
jgi:hypothetical protein